MPLSRQRESLVASARVLVHPAHCAIGDVIAMASPRLDSEIAHHLLPFRAMTGNLRAVELVSNEVCHLVGNCLRVEFSLVLREQNSVVPNHVLIQKRLAGRFPAKVKSYRRHREGPPVARTGEFNEAGRSLQRGQLNGGGDGLGACAHCLDDARQRRQSRRGSKASIQCRHLGIKGVVVVRAREPWWLLKGSSHCLAIAGLLRKTDPCETGPSLN